MKVECLLKNIHRTIMSSSSDSIFKLDKVQIYQKEFALFSHPSFILRSSPLNVLMVQECRQFCQSVLLPKLLAAAAEAKKLWAVCTYAGRSIDEGLWCQMAVMIYLRQWCNSFLYLQLLHNSYPVINHLSGFFYWKAKEERSLLKCLLQYFFFHEGLNFSRVVSPQNMK